MDLRADRLNRRLQAVLLYVMDHPPARDAAQFSRCVRLRGMTQLREDAQQTAGRDVAGHGFAILRWIRAVDRLLPRREVAEERRVRQPVDEHVLPLGGLRDG